MAIRATERQPEPSIRAAYTIEEFCEAYRIHRETVRRMINSGKLKTFKIGRRRLIPVEAAEALKAA